MSANAAAEHFSACYATARQRILALGEELGAGIESYPCNALGPAGEALFTDVITLGDSCAKRAVWMISGTHGAEGPFGSAAQLARLHKIKQDGVPDDMHIVLVHAINPYGFELGTRTNEDNVDINRNFVDFPITQDDTAYSVLHDALVPVSLEKKVMDKADAVLAEYQTEHGRSAYIRALSSGQYTYPDGLFYGGSEPSWSAQTWRHIVDQRVPALERLAIIDFHTGLGAPGEVTTLLVSADADRARRFLGNSMQDMRSGDTSSGANINGMAVFDVLRRYPGVDTTSIVAEIGSVAEQDVIQALRIDAYLASKPDLSAERASRLRKQVQGSFIVDCDDWKHAAVVNAETITDAVLNLVSV